jgi:DNA-binding MarR family transcriptional regulator
MLTALILEVFRLNGALIAVGNRLTEPMGLTSARWQVMGAIDLNDGPLTVSRIGRRMGLARQGVQRIVNELIPLGFLELRDNPDHRRAKLVAITKKGADVFSEIKAVQVDWSNDLSAGLSKHKIRGALTLLTELYQHLGDD